MKPTPNLLSILKTLRLSGIAESLEGKKGGRPCNYAFP